LVGVEVVGASVGDGVGDGVGDNVGGVVRHAQHAPQFSSPFVSYNASQCSRQMLEFVASMPMP
jgi:hypothetical protein